MVSWFIVGGLLLLATVCITDMIFKAHREHRGKS